MIINPLFTFLKAYIDLFQGYRLHNLALFDENKHNHWDGLVFVTFQKYRNDLRLKAAPPETV